jgi:hypothetical protein
VQAGEQPCSCAVSSHGLTQHSEDNEIRANSHGLTQHSEDNEVRANSHGLTQHSKNNEIRANSHGLTQHSEDNLLPTYFQLTSNLLPTCLISLVLSSKRMAISHPCWRKACVQSCGLAVMFPGLLVLPCTHVVTTDHIPGDCLCSVIHIVWLVHQSLNIR